MGSKGYSALGWIVWKFGSRAARRKLERNRGKLGAIAVIALVVAIGFALAGDDD